MLSELHVRDLGVIADLTVELRPGMTALTGETGAGKTLVVQALQLVLGGRASAAVVRSGADEALIEARFSPAPGNGASAAPAGAVPDPSWAGIPEAGALDDVILARSVASNGRSRAWVGGRMAPVAALSEVAASLVELHGQHDHHSLLVPAAQRLALDRFAGADTSALAAARLALADIDRRLAALGGDERDRARLADLLRYQIDEIAAASIERDDEEEALAAEEELLADVGILRGGAAEVLAAVEGDGGPAEPFGGARGLLGSAIAATASHRALAPWEERLRAVAAELDDLATDLRRTAETWEDDPARLASVQERRRRLADLRRKYGETLTDVVAFAADSRRTLDELEHQDELVARLAGEREAAQRAVAVAAGELRAARAAAAPDLAARVTARLHTLAMPGATFSVEVGEAGAGDAVEFLLAANRGEPLQPLARVASGGELARTMLALRLVVGGGAPTVLFDEVDAGVGGAAALALAAALRDVADRRQLLVVTHLPQVAAAADHQIAVRKRVDDTGRTVTAAHLLDPEERVVEVARMLSGHPGSATALAHAAELLDGAREAGAVTGDVTASR